MKEQKRHHAKPDKLLIYNYSKEGSLSPPLMPFKEEHHVKESNKHLIQDKVQRTSFWKYPKNAGLDPSTAMESEGVNGPIQGYNFKKGFAESYNPLQHKPSERLIDKVLTQAEKLANIEVERIQHDEKWKRED